MQVIAVATSAISDGTTITTDTVALLTATQTLTNKTLTSPTIGTSLDMNGNQLILDADADTQYDTDTKSTSHLVVMIELLFHLV